MARYCFPIHVFLNPATKAALESLAAHPMLSPVIAGEGIQMQRIIVGDPAIPLYLYAHAETPEQAKAMRGGIEKLIKNPMFGQMISGVGVSMTSIVVGEPIPAPHRLPGER